MRPTECWRARNTMNLVPFSLCLLFLICCIQLANCHRGRGGQRGPPLTFLDNLGDRYAVEEFFDIVKSEKPKGQVKAKLLDWAKQYRVEDELKKYMERQGATAKKVHDTAVGNLSGQALELFNKIWQINQDDQLTFLQDCQQIGQAFSQASPIVRGIVSGLLPPPPLPGPPSRGCVPLLFGGGGGGRGRGGGGGRSKGGSRGWRRTDKSSDAGGSSAPVDGAGGQNANDE